MFMSLVWFISVCGITAPLSEQSPELRGGRVLSTEILLPRIARQGPVCPISTRG